MRKSRLTAPVAALIFISALFFPQPPAHAQEPASSRQKVGVAFGGGSSRGFAHVGVIKWLEEHHIPIDFIAGTSMGGLIGGAYATGMSPDELESLLSDTDWNQMFGASSYRFKSIRRKQDARDYPSYLEFGLKSGLSMPPSLNNGQQVNYLLARVTAAYVDLHEFDDLPIPFRCVAVDLRTADQVVMERGQLDRSMRATMSLPGIFPPVELDGHLLVDGGAMNNVPADVVRAMGAQVVIAINVSAAAEPTNSSLSLLGIVGNTIDAMMRASTRRGMAQADIVITPELNEFGSLDWRRATEVIAAGYQAAEAMSARLLPLAVDAGTWQAYLSARNAKRRTTLPVLNALVIKGVRGADERQMRRLLEVRIGQPLDPAALTSDLGTLSGLDVYETINWTIERGGDQHSLVINATPKSYAPPFVMLATTLQNTTSEDFTFQISGRYLNYDVLLPRSELRIDGSLGSMPSVAVEFLQHVGASPLFAALSGGAAKRRFNFVDDDVVIAQYDQKAAVGQFDLGVELGRDSDARIGIRAGNIDADLRVGDPVFPSLSGGMSELRAVWRYDGQDSVTIPSSGIRSQVSARRVLEYPDVPSDFETDRTNDNLTQAEGTVSSFWSILSRRDRLFVTASLGTSFDGNPLPTDQFPLGYPLRLGAFDVGERRGDHYVAVSGGYMRGFGRLPDFLGGPIFGGTWLENGSAFDDISSASFATHVSIGLIAETMIGPALVATSLGFDGQRRFYIAIGRLFP